MASLPQMEQMRLGFAILPGNIVIAIVVVICRAAQITLFMRLIVTFFNKNKIFP